MILVKKTDSKGFLSKNTKKNASFDFFSWIARAHTDILKQGTKAGGFFFSPQVLAEHWFCTFFWKLPRGKKTKHPMINFTSRPFGFSRQHVICGNLLCSACPTAL
jgi:hypothetical protein